MEWMGWWGGERKAGGGRSTHDIADMFGGRSTVLASICFGWGRAATWEERHVGLGVVVWRRAAGGPWRTGWRRLFLRFSPKQIV